MICVQLRIDMPKRKRAKWSFDLDVLRREDANDVEGKCASVFEEMLTKALHQIVGAMEKDGVVKGAKVTEIKDAK